MEKIDFRTQRRDVYSPSAREFALVEVPPFDFFAVDGQGDPNTSADYAAAVTALYAASYAAKSASRRDFERDYVVAPLEGLWTADSIDAYVAGRRDEWSWTMLIRQPDWFTDKIRTEAIGAAERKSPALLRFIRISEGLSVQIMHVGPYSAEAPTIARLHNGFLPENGLVENGPHHEVYLGDPRRAAPAKLKTVLRQPVRRA